MPNSQTTCSVRGCGLMVDEANLCFAHKSAKLVEVLADVMARKKIVSAQAGGVSVTLHPEGFLHEHDEAAPEDEGPQPPKPSPSLRDLERVNGLPVDEEQLFAASEGGMPDGDL